MSEPKKKTVYKPSPFGPAIHPWVNRPDTKFNAEGVFKVGLRLSGKEAEDLKAEIDTDAQAFFDEVTAEMTPGERKKWSIHYPYTVEEDDDGNPTGDIIFNFRQNAVIKLRDGSTKEVKVGVYDSMDNDMHKPVFGGSILRVMFSKRGIKMVSNKSAGIRLDFSMVQVKELAKGTGGGRGFGKVAGGYVEHADEEDVEHGQAEASADTGGDY